MARSKLCREQITNARGTDVLQGQHSNVLAGDFGALVSDLRVTVMGGKDSLNTVLSSFRKPALGPVPASLRGTLESGLAGSSFSVGSAAESNSLWLLVVIEFFLSLSPILFSCPFHHRLLFLSLLVLDWREEEAEDGFPLSIDKLGYRVTSEALRSLQLPLILFIREVIVSNTQHFLHIIDLHLSFSRE
ncbi:hypothetical protein E5288_WYG016752 [Bos mutus]|uniref:Uncharacterized protein n=1 Tax=Bos mutus TaxID=72004 RepID=A0A6B0R9V8_9CETA|nr:hypothetical protein [Bos mutus]